MTRYTVIVAMVLLAACGSNEAASNASDEGPASTPVEQTPEDLQIDPVNRVVPLDPPGNAAAPAVVPGATPSSVTAIPASFRGRWGMNAADCDPRRDDAKGLMTVSADSLRFWESRATFAEATLAGATTLVANLSFTGEGQNWRERTRIVVQDDGRTLVYDSEGDGQGGGQTGTRRYTRCPG